MSPEHPLMSRKTFLRGALGAVAGSGLATTLGSTPAAAAVPAVTKIKNLAGTGANAGYGVGATDLGIPARCPDGRTLYVFGDTWTDTVGGNNWRSPVALWSTTTNLAAGVTFSGAVGGAVAQQLWYYPHDNYYQTVIPSDVITIGGTMYLHAIVNGPTFGTVRWTEIWKSTDSGASWQNTGARFDTAKDGGMFQLISWGQGNDGFVYVVSTGFQRDKGFVLNRVPEGQIATPSAYQGWGWNGSNWGWGRPASVILGGQFGELCLRPLGGKWLLTYFDAGNYRIDAMVLNTPTDNLVTAPKTTLIYGGSWGQENNNHVAQLYGGYVIPGSTLQDLHLTVSQWNTTAGAGNIPYHAMQFRVQGLV